MGSFYSSCSISGMTLSNQKTSILLLTPNAELSEHRNMIVSNDGCQAFYSPFGFPVHGTYDDYGYIVNIIRDKNVEMLETYFGVDIESILQGIGDRDTPKGIKHQELYQTLAMTYFRTEVLEYLEKGWEIQNSKMIQDLLKGLDKNNKITEEEFENLMRKRLDKTITEDERELLTNHILGVRIGQTYVASHSGNMFKILPINSEFKEYVLKQYNMIIKLGFELRRTLIPSDYGSQDNNWSCLYKFNDFVNDLLVEDIRTWYEGDEEEKEILRIHQGVKRDRKINSILK